MLTAIITHYYPNRRKYLSDIVKALQSGTVAPDEIIIFNNNPKPLHIDGAVTINSEMNFGCVARAVAGILGKGDTILMQDDDLLIGEDLIQIAVDALEVAPNSIFGIMGRNLIDGKYTLESEVSGRAGIILGRVLIMRRATLMRCMSLYDGNLLFRFHDDIFYSLVNKLKFGEQNYVISNSGCINLDEEGIGVSWDPEHLNNRNKTVRHVQQLVGWKFTGE